MERIDRLLCIVTKSLIQAGVDSAVQGADGKLAMALDHKGTLSDGLVLGSWKCTPNGMRVALRGHVR